MLYRSIIFQSNSFQHIHNFMTMELKVLNVSQFSLNVSLIIQQLIVFILKINYCKPSTNHRDLLIMFITVFLKYNKKF